MRLRIFSLTSGLFLTLALMACSQQNDIEIHEPRVEAAPKSQQSTHAYLTIQNHTPTERTLVSVVTHKAAETQFYRLPMSGPDASAKPRMIQQVKIPPMGRAEFEPNAQLIKLEGLLSDLTPGDTVILTLEFANGDIENVEAQVTTQGQTAS